MLDMTRSWKYAHAISYDRRSDIQGLRAIAVAVVVLFHSGLGFSGGYVGVDIFFVISGYVITGTLSREWSRTGRINFYRFYVRRFRRLIPALALVIAITYIASALLLSPFGTQTIAALTGIGALLFLVPFRGRAVLHRIPGAALFRLEILTCPGSVENGRQSDCRKQWRYSCGSHSPFSRRWMDQESPSGRRGLLKQPPNVS